MSKSNQIEKNNRKIFYHLLSNTLIVAVINMTLWFAITFFVYLQTRSVFATAIISGIFLVATALTGIWFGSIVDHLKKKTAMIASSIASLLAYIVCFVFYLTVGADAFKDPASSILWIFIIILMLGIIAGNIRTIAMPTLVTILIPEEKRDRANGLVGTATGLSFLVTSVISGLLVAAGGMFYALLLAMGTLIASLIHLFFLSVPEKSIVRLEDTPSKIDVKGTFKIVRAVPGLIALILFTTFNNFLGGVFMALMDAYGLSLMSVETWGLLWGVLSAGFIIGGLVIARRGLGKNPVRTLMLVNIILWIICIIFPLQASIPLLATGMFIYMCLGPFVEASEQTVLQKVVPLERQGRVFGFAQSIEQAASPLTAFLIGPIAQFIFIPHMTNGEGARLIGGWFGTGTDRGIALVFILAGFIGLVATIIAFNSKYYRRLSERYIRGPKDKNTPRAPTLSEGVKEGLAG